MNTSLDVDNDGSVTEKELSSFLNISPAEARALITEAKIQLYGNIGRDKIDQATLTFEEFKSVLASQVEEEDAEGSIISKVRMRSRIY